MFRLTITLTEKSLALYENYRRGETPAVLLKGTDFNGLPIKVFVFHGANQRGWPAPKVLQEVSRKADLLWCCYPGLCNTIIPKHPCHRWEGKVYSSLDRSQRQLTLKQPYVEM